LIQQIIDLHLKNEFETEKIRNELTNYLKINFIKIFESIDLNDFGLIGADEAIFYL
jgi:hypothetical protein